MKILIVGSKGMLAQDLIKVFKENNALVLVDKDNLDVTNEAAVKEFIESEQPDIIMNDSAFTNVDEAETHKETAFAVNALAVKYLAEAAVKNSCLLVHFSTDYVFGQENKDSYTEDAQPLIPRNVYSQSKLEGERNIINIPDVKYYICRLSWLFGPSASSGQAPSGNYGQQKLC